MATCYITERIHITPKCEFKVAVLAVTCLLASCINETAAQSGNAPARDTRAAEAEWCDKFRAALRKRSDAVQTVSYDVEGTTRIPKGSKSKSFSTKAPPELAVLPAEDLSLPCASSWMFDFHKGKMRHNLFRHVLYRDDKARRSFWFPRHEYWMYDGTQLQQFFPREANTSDKYTPPQFQTDLYLGSPRSFGFFPQNIDDVFFLAHGRLPQFDGGAYTRVSTPPRHEDLKWLGPSLIGSTECQVFRSRLSDLMKISFEFWVDFTRDGAVIRQVRRMPDRDVDQLDIQYGVESGLWLPTAYDFHAFGSDGMELEYTHCKVKTVRINIPLESSLFHIQPRPGMIVYDDELSASYRIEPDGSKRTVEDLESELVNPGLLKGPLRFYLYLINGLFILGVALAIWRRYGRERSQ